MKEYNIKRHYCTKHSASYDNIVGQLRVDKMQQLKKVFEQTARGISWLQGD